LSELSAPMQPRVEHELDTQNFENFDEEGNAESGGSGSRKYAAKLDPNFIGYTYKNMEAVHPDGDGVMQVRKKASSRPTLASVQDAFGQLQADEQ